MSTTKRRLIRQILEKFTKTNNRDPKLVKLTRKFNVYKKKLRELILVLREHHAAVAALNKTQSKVARSVASLTKESPISNIIGAIPKGQATEPNPNQSARVFSLSNQNRPNHNASVHSSYLSIHESIESQRNSYLNFFDEFIIDVVRKLEQVQLARVGKALQESDRLRREMNHYDQKTTKLEKSLERLKTYKPQFEAKVVRNVFKSKDAKRMYEDHFQDLCLLLEEMTDRGWRDLFPILLKLSQSDLYVATFEHEAMSGLHRIIRDLENIGAKFQVPLNSRIDLFQTMSATELSTKHLEMQGMGIATTESNKNFQDDMSLFMEMSQSFMEVSTPVQVDDNQDEVRSIVECATLESNDASLNKDEEPTPSATDNNIEDEDEIILAPAPVLAEDEDTTGIVSDPKGDASHADDEMDSNDDDNCDDISLSPRPSEA